LLPSEQRSGLAAAIQRDWERLVEEWQAACRIASVTGTGAPDLFEMADWVETRLRSRFDRVIVESVDRQPPVILGELIGEGSERLIVYTHYDVQPAGDATAWTVEPFSAEIRDGAVYARGCCDDKADITARLQAIDLWLEGLNGRRPPLTILWICEGAEEIGSPGLEYVLERHADWLQAPHCLWESFLRRPDGRPEIAFGCRGLLAVELTVRLLAADQHAAFAPVLQSSTATLARALASLANERGEVLVDGFHDAVVKPDPAAIERASNIDPPGDGMAPNGGSAAIVGLSREELASRLIFTPTANISAMSAGDFESDNTVVPALARAKLDFHLVPDQSPSDVARKLRTHLDAHGFAEVEIEVLNELSPAPSSLESALGRAAIVSAAEVYGEPVVYPLLPGAGPGRLLLDILGASIVSPAGTTRLSSGIHGPDEHGSVTDYLDHVHFTAHLLEQLGSVPQSAD
jgi:acetylornithine deacetylase/succinyl-diaminopimelate desuccinylase-like protein